MNPLYVDTVCPTCGAIYRQCWDCGGDGQVNNYNLDPSWYLTEDDAWEDCSTCDGDGGWWLGDKCLCEVKEDAS